MTPFLKLVADDLYGKLGGDFQDVTLIFPNKRASLFFNEHLWENAGGRTIWTPEYTTISELFAQLSDCTVGDPIGLAVKLWEVYRRRMNPSKSLDQLYSLMEMMLSDFQDIDNNLVEPRKLFLNIADLKELTDFSFLEQEQREAIEQFFGRFFEGGDAAETPLKTRFKTMWNHLADIYEVYRAALLDTDGEEPMVYEGMLKRMVVETLRGKGQGARSEDEEKRVRMDRRLTSRTYVMVGFNVLNKTELELFRYIKQERDAKFYWDYDVAYTGGAKTSKMLSKYEAGQFILENIRLLGDELKGKDLFRNMRLPKEITFIQSPTEDAQTRYVEEWKRTHVKEGEPLRESAVVLCNEHLLQPVLHSIGEVSALNVTMGYPLASTPVFSLVQALLELQVHGRTASGAWRYKYVAAVLKHAFIQKLVGEDCLEKLQMLSRNNVVFPNMDMFKDHETLKRLFTPVSGKELTAYLSDIISRVGHSYQDTYGSRDFTLQIYKESIFVAYTVVNRIHTLQESHTALTVGDEMLRGLILQLMSQATIPFHGEPAVGLQVMGLLETRNLDFRHVIMLSVNEGQLPKSDKRPSLIPYTLRAAYGMTTIEKEVSLYAYYYYRLMQRAESITLLYNSSTEGGSRGEMSRFMLQTLAEAKDLFGTGQKIDLRAFTAPSQMVATERISVVKDKGVMERLHARFNQKRILSPSAINTYMQCPLKFYLNYVAGLRPDEEVSEEIDRPMFGIIFHDAMRHLYEPYEGRPFASHELLKLAEDEELITQKLNNAFAVNLFHEPEKDTEGHPINYGGNPLHPLHLNGTQLINRHVIKRFVINQIRADAKTAEELEREQGYWQIISQEKEYKTGTDILLGGIIDRLDLLASPRGNRIRVVDYKTGSKVHEAKTIAELFDPQKCVDNYHIMQTLYYCKVLTSEDSEYKDTPIVPALMYCAKEHGGNHTGIVKLTPPNGTKKEAVQDFKTQYGEEYNTLLTQKIAEIFTSYEENPDHGIFTQCEDKQHCRHCDFLALCS